MSIGEVFPLFAKRELERDFPGVSSSPDYIGVPDDGLSCCKIGAPVRD
jgi:hypothetical protein